MPDADPPRPLAEPSRARSPRAWPWIVALAGAGVLLACLPHLINAARHGDPSYIADGDGLLYLAWSRDAVLHGSPRMTDAVHRPSGPMMHPWVLFVPPALLAHALGLGMTGLGLIWRALGGAGIALGLFAAIRPHATTPRKAAAVAAFLLFDTGLLFGQVVQRDAEILLSMASGTGAFLSGVPRIFAHLRVPPPALAIPFLLGFFALAQRARLTGTARSVVAAGVALGFLFHVYFYFATAAIAGVVLTWVLDRGGRRTYAGMIAIGLAVAAPALIAGYWIKASTPPDWLLRSGKFVRVGRLDRAHLLLPRVLIAEWLGAGWLVLRTRRDLILLWCTTGAGLALANQQVATGLDLENFHWTYAYGVTFSLLLALLALPYVGLGRAWRWAGPLVLAAQVGVGLGLRAVETNATAETNAYAGRLDRWRSDGHRLPTGAVVAGPDDLLFLLAAVEEIDPLDCRLVEFSSAATDRERDDRRALNRALVESDLDPPAPPGQFGVTLVIRPAGMRPPPGFPALVSRGTSWDVWGLPPEPGRGGGRPD